MVGGWKSERIEKILISLIFVWLGVVDTVFFPPSICVPDPKNPKNIIFSPWVCKSIQDDVAQPVRALKHLKCLFFS